MAVRKRRATSNKIDEYFEDMERWAEQVRETFTEKPSWDLENCAIEPLRDMTVTPREVIVTVDLPYAEKENTSSRIGRHLQRRRHPKVPQLDPHSCKGRHAKNEGSTKEGNLGNQITSQTVACDL